MNAQESTSKCIVITTCENRKTAELLAQSILENRLAACVQLSNISSFYIWDDKINNEDEVKLLIKTKESLYKELEKHISDLHTYDVPEIIMLPIADGAKSYLDWIDDVTNG